MSTSSVATIYRKLAAEYPTFDESDDEWMQEGLSSTPFRALVSVSLSTMTSTPRTVKAAVALFDLVSSFEDLAYLDDDTLRDAIHSVAHYNRKTRTLKAMAQQINDHHNGHVPSTRDDLMGLPGVGRKCTDIMMNFTFDEPTIAVDTHVARVVRRLGLSEARSNDEIADELIEVTPARYRKHAHEWLIQHGMKTCKSRRPACTRCVLTAECDYFRRR